VLHDAAILRDGHAKSTLAQCLLPLANIPLIEYTFEFLAMSGVEEVFVCCGAHTDQVEEYIEWVNP